MNPKRVLMLLGERLYLTGLILLESRLEFLHKRFHDRALEVLTAENALIPAAMNRGIQKQTGEDVAEKFINYIISVDPDPQKKNTQWLLTLILRNKQPIPMEDLQGATETLTKFAEMKQAGQIPADRRDINTYRSMSDLYAVLRGEQQQALSADETEHAEMMKEAKLLYDGPDASVIMPLTLKAGCYFGRNTDWCTAWGSHEKLGLRQQGRFPTRTNMYDQYAKQGPLYIIELKPDGTLYQYHTESNQFMDSADRMLSDNQAKALLKSHPNIMKAIGEDRFVKQYLSSFGASFFSPEAILRADPNSLVRGVTSIEDYQALPEAVRNRPAFTAAILLARPEITLPKELMTDEVAASLREASANRAVSANVLAAFQFFGMDQWLPEVIESGIVRNQLSMPQYHQLTQLLDRAFTAGDYIGYKLDVSGRHLYLTISGPSVGWFLVSNNVLESLSFKADPANLIQILNTLKVPPVFDVEQMLAAEFQVYYNKIRYGPLGEVGKPDVQEGDTTLMRLGSRLMWVAVLDHVPTDQRLWMRGKSLEDLVTRHIDADFKATVRKLALKYKAQKVVNADRFGILNTKAGIVADFPSFIDRAGKIPNMGYPINLEDSDEPREMLGMAVGAFGNRLSSDEQAQLYEVMRADEARPKTLDTGRIYDIDVPTIEIALPTANSLLAITDVITERSLHKKIMTDIIHAIAGAAKIVASHRYGRVVLAHRVETIGKADHEALQKLDMQIDELRRSTAEAVAERRRNPDKYATDLSGRFAALNAFKKRF